MPERRLVVIDPAGLHARPAARFVQVASRCASTVTIGFGDRTADAKSLIGVLGLTIRPGAEIVLATAGLDAAPDITLRIGKYGPYLETATPGVSPAVAEPDLA